MSTKINDGGPAFPRSAEEEISVGVNTPHEQILSYGHPGYDGMSLRDYFAGQALSATQHSYGTAYTALAKHAYLIADAMLAARAKPAASPRGQEGGS